MTTEVNNYSNFLDKYEEHLSNFLINFSAGRVIDKPGLSMRTNALRACKVCDEARRRKEYARECLILQYILHLEAIQYIKTGDLSTRSLEVLKYGDKLDRLFKNAEGYYTFYPLGLKGLVQLERYQVRESRTGTANPPRFVYDFEKSKALAVFKKRDPAPIFPTIPAKQNHRRQIAAYMIDRRNGGHVSVPFSMIGKVGKEKGSVQIYKKHAGTLYNLVRNNDDTRRSITDIPLQELQLISIHRSRLYDLDSHFGNVLFKRTKDGTVKLIPIDMEYSLPRIRNKKESNDSRLRIGWAYFPYMYNPLSSEVKNYVLSLDPNQDARVLQELNLPKSCIRLMKAATWLWQEGARRNMLPVSIIEVLGSNKFKELLIPPARVDDHSLKANVSKLLDEYLNYINPFVTPMKAALQEMKTTGNLASLKEILFNISKKNPYLFYALLRFIVEELPLDKAKEILQVFKEKGELLDPQTVLDKANIVVPPLD